MKKNQTPLVWAGPGNNCENNYPKYSPDPPQNQPATNIIQAAHRFRVSQNPLRTSARALEKALTITKAKALANRRRAEK